MLVPVSRSWQGNAAMIATVVAVVVLLLVMRFVFDVRWFVWVVVLGAIVAYGIQRSRRARARREGPGGPA